MIDLLCFLCFTCLPLLLISLIAWPLIRKIPPLKRKLEQIWPTIYTEYRSSWQIEYICHCGIRSTKQKTFCSHCGCASEFKKTIGRYEWKEVSDQYHDTWLFMRPPWEREGILELKWILKPCECQATEPTTKVLKRWDYE